MISRCCGQWSYRQAAETLEDLCGIALCHTVIGNVADETAAALSDSLANNTAIREHFQKAKGEVEFYADGTFIRILNADGTIEWREVKCGAWAKRMRGASALPSELATRKLPQHTAVSAFAVIGNKEDFLERCRLERCRVGVGGVSSTLGDGAKWIWNVAREVHGKTDECLDIYHAAEHIAACSKVLHGETQAGTDWFEGMRWVLLSEGWSGMERELSALLSGGLKKSQRGSVGSLLEYFRGHSERLNYCERLAAGRVIGSGLIEGACKNLVGRRMKQTGAAWGLERANRIAFVCSLLYSDQWKRVWKNAPKI